jgi:hypothetical protein
MKFKDKKSGEVFHNIENVQTAYCERIHADCTSCPLSITNNTKIIYCYSFAAKYPEDAAALIGVEAYD